MGKQWTLPADARAEYKALIQRANRRILSNLKYVKDEGIQSKSIVQSLTGGFNKKKNWAGKSTPLSSSVKFASEKDYNQYMRFVMRWGEGEGRDGKYRARPDVLLEKAHEAVTVAVTGLFNHKGVSLEAWKGHLPPELKEQIKSMNLEQVNRFFEHIDVTGEEDLYDSEQVEGDTVEKIEDYVSGRISEVQHYYPAQPKIKKKRKKRKKKSRRKTKGRKKI